MEDSKRQKQVAGLIMQEMSDIFQKQGLNVIDGGMLSIADVKVTPDLMEARIFLSFFQIKDDKALLESIRERTWEFRKLLGVKVRNQLRRVPEIFFLKDETLDYVFKMEELFKKINEDKNNEEDK